MKNELTRSKTKLKSLSATLLLVAACSNVVRAQSTYQGPPTSSGSNVWSLAENWTSGVPNAVDAAAEVNYGVATEIEVDGVFTIGSLTFSGGATGGVSMTTPTKPTSFDPSKGLTFATSSGVPTIAVADATGNLFYYNSLYGTQGFQKTGPGRLTFRFNTLDHAYSGTVDIKGGTIGLNQAGSLGNSDNDLRIGATDGVSTTATLLAEPASGSETLTLASTRSITLTGGGARFQTSNPANDQRVRMQIDGSITDGGAGFGYSVTGGLVTVAGANSYTGTTSITSGTLVAATPASLPGYDVAGKVTPNGGSIVVRMGGVGEWSLADLSTLKANASFAGAAALGIDTTNATGTVDWAGLTAGETYSIAKVGAGTLRITGTNNYTGTRARIYDGTLALAPGASLPANVTAIFFRSALATPATLDLGGNTQSIASISPAVGARSVVSNGNLTLTADANFDVSNAATGTIVDLSGLSSFTFSRTNRAVRVLPGTVNNTSGTGTINELYLAGGTNLFNVNNVQVGGAAGSSQGLNHEGRMFLGTTNTFNVTGATAVFQLGGFNGTGRVAFQSGLTNPTLKIRAGDGTSPIPFVRVGETSSGVRNGGGNLDLSLGAADISAVDFVVGRHIAASGNAEGSTFSMGGGTVNASRLILGQKVNGGANPPTPTFNDPFLSTTVNLNGGTITASTVLLADAQTGTSAAVPNPGATKYIINVNLNGGELRAGAISNVTGTHVNAFSEAASVRNFNFNGGVLTHLAGQDLSIAGTASTDTDDATTGNLIFLRVPAGNTGGIRVDAGRKVMLADTVRISDSGTATPTVGMLVKTGVGGLQVNGAIVNGAGLKVDGGAVQVSNGTVPSRADINATLIVDYAGATVLNDVVANIVAGYNTGTWDGGTGYISSGAATQAAPKLALGYAESSVLYGAGPTTVAGLTVDNTAVVVIQTLAGDTNLDKKVDFDDLLALAQNYGLGSGGLWSQGDVNYNGTINFDDLLALAQNYGFTALTTGSFVIDESLAGRFQSDWALARSMVPEPALMSLTAAVSLALRRRRNG